MSAVALAALIVAISFLVGLVVGAILVMALPAFRESFRRRLPASGEPAPKPPDDDDAGLEGDRTHWPGETGYTNGHLG